MTREVREQSGRNFHKSYPLPQNQLDFGIALQGDMEVLFPDHAVLLKDAIETLQRVIGIGVPKYKIVLDDAAEAQRAGHADENGFASTGRTGFSKVQLAPAKRIGDVEANSMSPEEKDTYEITRNGTVVDMEVGPAVRRLLESLYSLTGATLLRDDHSAGYADGGIVRKGFYLGEPIYFETSFDTSALQTPNGTMSVFILDEQSGKDALNALNITQLREFCNLTGFGFSKAREMEFSGEITAANYLAVGALLRVTKQIVDNVPGFRG